MSRPRTGNLRERRRADETMLYTARVMAYGNRETVVLGEERDGMTRLMARRALRGAGQGHRAGHLGAAFPTRPPWS